MSSTVIVRLRRDWFSGDSLYEVRHNPHEFPASWADKPTKEQLEKNPEQRYAVLPSTAEVVEDAAVVATLRNTANGEQVVVAEAVEGDVKSVGGALDDKGVEKPSQSLAKAEAGAEARGVDQVGGKPRESNPPGGQPGGVKK